MLLYAKDTDVVYKNRACGKNVPVMYVLAEYWCDYDNGLASGNAGTPTVEIYCSLESARNALEAKVEHERSEGLIAEWHDIDGYMEEINENSFECWIDGEWMEKHLLLAIQPCKVNE